MFWCSFKDASFCHGSSQRHGTQLTRLMLLFQMCCILVRRRSKHALLS